MLFAFAEFDQTLRMGDAGRGAEEDGRIELFGDLAGITHEILAFLGVGRFDERHFRGARVVAVVLLVLRGMHGRIVSVHDHEATLDTEVRGGEERVGGNVQTDHFHGGDGAAAGDGGAVGDLEGDLFVRRPFAVDVVTVLRQVFDDFRTGRAGIGACDLDAGFPDAPGNGFIAG